MCLVELGKKILANSGGVDLLIKSLNNYRYLGLKDLAQKLLMRAYLESITEIVHDCQQIGTGALLIIGNYILGLFLGNQCFFYFTHIAKIKLEECQPQVQQFC